MANHYFGISQPGGTSVDPNDVSTGTSTTSKNVELVVLDGVTGRNKLQVLACIEAIYDKVLLGDEPA